MSAPFPLTPAPAYYTQVTVGQARGVFYSGGTAPFVTLSKTGATTYTVRDYYGNVVSSGSVSGLTVTPTAPGGGWPCGWYRIYFTGGSTDSLFGPAYASSTFVVVPSDSRFPTIAAAGFSLTDLPMKAAMGMGSSRIPIDNANAPTTGSNNIANAQALVTQSKTYWNVTSGATFDSARPRLLMVNFPGQTSDMVALGALHVYCKNGTIDGSTVTITAVAGTSSGTKITVNTETYDNLADVAAAITALAASAFVRGFGNGSLANITATVIGNAYFNGVKSVVSTLYPDVTRYEGPSNEPNLNTETVQQMLLFQAAVHAGNASAKAIGPCPVDISNLANWRAFLDGGGGAYCDEFSFHAYNAQTQGDINQGRTGLSAFVAMLTSYGLQSKPMWQTESTQVMSSVYGVYHPRRSRVPLLQTLLWEQSGLARERNVIWYDTSHGFWAFPAWAEMGDGTLNPFCVLYRTLGAETFGMTHNSIVSFGTVGDRIFLGSIYTGASASVAVIQATSALPNASVTLTVTGASSLTVVDGFGNQSTATVTSGRTTVPVSDIPTYVRIPAGVTLAVFSCNDWPPLVRTGWANGAHGYNVSATGTVSPATAVTDGQWIYQYGSLPNGVGYGTTMPDTETITWPTATRLDRVLIWAGFAWQSDSTLADFDVQTSVDGTTWITQATVTKTNVTSFQFGSDANGTGCQRETYWDDQYVFDVKLPAPVTCKAVRLNVRATSYGGEPDAACLTTGGQGNSAQYITLQEVIPICDDNAYPQPLYH